MTALPAPVDTDFEDYTTRLDWRWARAMTLYAEGERPAVGFDDKFVVRAFRYTTAFEDTANVSQKQRLRQMYAAECRVCSYRFNADGRRFRMEALCLCADLTQKDVARILDEDVKVVELFEKFFFDVRDKNKDAVYNVIFPPLVTEGLHDRVNDSDLMWKFVALEGGYQHLKSFFRGGAVADSETDAFFVSVGRSAILRKYGLANYCRRIDTKEDFNMITEQAQRIRELDIKETEAGGSGVPEAQKTILAKCVEGTLITVIDPDFHLTSSYEPTVEQQLDMAEPAIVPTVKDVVIPADDVEIL